MTRVILTREDKIVAGKVAGVVERAVYVWVPAVGRKRLGWCYLLMGWRTAFKYTPHFMWRARVLGIVLIRIIAALK